MPWSARWRPVSQSDGARDTPAPAARLRPRLWRGSQSLEVADHAVEGCFEWRRVTSQLRKDEPSVGSLGMATVVLGRASSARNPATVTMMAAVAVTSRARATRRALDCAGAVAILNGMRQP